MNSGTLKLNFDPALALYVNALSDKDLDEHCDRELNKHIEYMELLISGWKTYRTTENRQLFLFLLQSKDKTALHDFERLFLHPRMAERARAKKRQLDDNYSVTTDTGTSTSASSSVDGSKSQSPVQDSQNSTSHSGALLFTNDFLTAADKVEKALYTVEMAQRSALNTISGHTVTTVTQSGPITPIFSNLVSTQSGGGEMSRSQKKRAKKAAKKAEAALMTNEVREKSENPGKVGEESEMAAQTLTRFNKREEKQNKAETNEDNLKSEIMSSLRKENQRNVLILQKINEMKEEKFDEPFQGTEEELVKFGRRFCAEAIIRWEESSKPQAPQYLQMYKATMDMCTPHVARTIYRYSSFKHLDQCEFEHTMLLQYQTGNLLPPDDKPISV